MSSSNAKPGTLQPVQTRAVVLWKTAEYIGLLLFILAVPRLMGPELYGRFAVLLSLIGVLTLITGLGAQAVFARYIPEYEGRGDRERTREVFLHVLIARSLVAMALGVAFIFVFPRLMDGVTATTVVLGMGAFLLTAVGLTSFQLFYGLNSFGRWLTHDALSRILVLAVLALVGGFDSIERAALSLFLAETVLAALGVYWARSFFALGPGTFDASSMWGHLRFGIVFFAASLFLMLAWRGGEIVVALFTRASAEVAYFNIANAAVMAFAGLVGQLTTVLTPSVTSLYLAGRSEQMEAWLGYSLKYLTILSFGFILLVFVFGRWAVSVLLGEEYVAVLPNLEILVLALPLVALINTGFSLAVARHQPREAVTAAVAGLVSYLALAAILVPAFDSVGASLALVFSLVVSSALAYFRLSLSPLLARALYWRVLAGGFLVAGGVRVMAGRWPPLGLILALGFVPLLFRSGVVTREECTKLLALFGVRIPSARAGKRG